MISLLDAEPDLGRDLDPADFEAARQLRLATVRLTAGTFEWQTVAETDGVEGDMLGWLVLDGAMTHDASLLGRVCTRLLVAGDLVLLDGEPTASVPVERTWGVPQAVQLAVLDTRLLVACVRWPLLQAALLRRVAAQDRVTLTQQAISQLPRVEDRLLAFLWLIADRRGRVLPDGVHVSLPVTHATLGRMIGARRPTVSLGLTSLAEEGLLTYEGSAFVLRHDSLAQSGPDAYQEIEA